MADMRAVRTSSGSSAAVQAEVAEDVLQVRLHGVDGTVQDGGYLLVGLPLGDPVNYLCLTEGELELLCQNVDRLAIVEWLLIIEYRHSRP